MASLSPGTRALIEALDEPAMLIEAGRVRLANLAAQRLLGIGIEGSDVRLAIRHPRALERLLPGTPGDIEITGIGQFDRPWTLSVRALGGGALLVRLIDRSATIAAERMRVDFVANASHELRTPLSTILGFSETLADEVELEAPQRTRFGEIIRGEAKRMLRIIEDLMSLSRIEAGRFIAPTEPVDIPSLVEMAAANARTIAGARECDIETVLQEDLPPVVGDHGQLLQLLDNLLTNAIRYGCRDGRCQVTISAAAEDGAVRLAVRDYGPGIPRDHLPRVTERFYRVDAARSRDSGGTGLGLAIVKHIVERHRGNLTINSSEGDGTEVLVRLPAATQQPLHAVTKL
ncbi:ATP-binding protein [Sphingomonas sp.]|uniref:sensor histidine kinase n=1 Tax=Sphingomonas sp. TaxID=28214 RepID=UPI00286E3FF6|nr:ATP-binding protein [Sphingomonas sp.]